MGLRNRILGRAKRIADRFSGEFSDPAPEETQPYERPGIPNENAEVVMAKLNRPKRAPRPTPKKED
jgi:hypothetical protein